MHEQDELAVVGRQEEPLAAPLRTREPPPVERRERRVECLQRRDVRRACLLDGKHADGLVERPSLRLYLGEFRHVGSGHGGAAQRSRQARRDRRVRAPASTQSRSGTAQSWPAQETLDRRLAALVREADPGASARARAQRPERRSGLAIAAASHFGTPMHVEAVRALLRRRPAAARTSSRAACRPAPARAGLPQLLRQARRDDRGLPRARLARRGLLPADHPLQRELLDEVADAAGVDRARGRERQSTAAALSASRSRSSARPSRSPGSTARGRRHGSQPRCVPGPSSWAERAGRIPS